LSVAMAVKMVAITVRVANTLKNQLL
jgi:hypothetical protein